MSSSRPSEIPGAVVLGIYAILVVVPLLHVVTSSFVPDSDLGSATWWTNYANTFGLARYIGAIGNSIVMSVLCPLLGLVLAIPIAWLLARTDMPARRFVFALVFGAFVTPGFVNALAWLLLFSPRTGYVNELWSHVLKIQAVLMNIFTLHGLVFASLAAVYPVAVVFLYNAFSTLDPDLEESARVVGEEPLHILRTITLPLVRPAIVASLIIMLLETLVLFATPAIIGVPANIATIPTQLWALFEQYPPGMGRAAALSVPLMLVTAALLWLQRQLSAPAASSRMSRTRVPRVELKGWRWPSLLLVALALSTTFVLPIGVLIATSLSNTWLGGFSPANFTFVHYANLFTDRDSLLSISDSLIAAGAAAFLCVAVGGLAAYISERRIARTGPLIGFLSMAPMAVPSMVYAIGVFVAFALPPAHLYGTLAILMLAYASKFIPFAFMTCKSAIASVPLALEDSARIVGASSMQVLRHMTLPLARGGALAAWIFVFVISLKELPASILLYTVKTPVIGTQIMKLYTNSHWEEMAALSIVLLVMSTLVIAVAHRFWGNSAAAEPDKERSVGITSRLASFVAGTPYDGIPERVVAISKQAIENAAAAGLAAAGEREVDAVVAYLDELGGKPECTVLGYRLRTSPAFAALANAMMMELPEFDGAVRGRFNPAQRTVLPTVMAVAERVGASGKETIAAFTLGCEAATKIGAIGDLDNTVRPLMAEFGWNVSAVAGLIGAAAAAGRLLGLGAEGMETVLGMAASMASGVGVSWGTSIGHIDKGLASMHGVMAASFAKRGLTAARDGIEAERGFLYCFRRGNEVDEEAFFRALANPYDVIAPGILLKFYPCASFAGPPIEAALHLVAEHGIAPELIQSVHAETTQLNTGFTFPNPVDLGQARRSVHYCVATALVHGRPRLRHFTEAALRDERVLALMRRVTWEPSLQGTKEVPTPAVVTLKLNDGRTLSHRAEYEKGHPGNPLTLAELDEKFEDCAEGKISASRIGEALESFHRLEELPNVAPLFGLLGRTQ